MWRKFLKTETSEKSRSLFTHSFTQLRPLDNCVLTHHAVSLNLLHILSSLWFFFFSDFHYSLLIISYFSSLNIHTYTFPPPKTMIHQLIGFILLSFLPFFLYSPSALRPPSSAFAFTFHISTSILLRPRSPLFIVLRTIHCLSHDPFLLSFNN